MYAVPFGSPVLTCYYRADLLAKLGQKPPHNWGEYHQLAKLLGNRKALGDAAPPAEAPWRGAVEPLGPGWAGLVLLARAAPYAKSQSNYSALFDMRTMEPLISGPPLVRALEELAAAAKLGPAEQLSTTRLRPGPRSGGGNAAWHCLALGREAGRQENDASADAGRDGPPADAEKAVDAATQGDAEKHVEVGFVELPGSRAGLRRQQPHLEQTIGRR